MRSVLDCSPVTPTSVWAEDFKASLRAQVAGSLILTKKWESMSREEHTICVEHVVAQCSSDFELSARLDEIGCTIQHIIWTKIDSGDRKALNQQKFFRFRGGLISKTGALVSIITPTDSY